MGPAGGDNRTETEEESEEEEEEAAAVDQGLQGVPSADHGGDQPQGEEPASTVVVAVQPMGDGGVASGEAGEHRDVDQRVGAEEGGASLVMADQEGAGEVNPRVGTCGQGSTTPPSLPRAEVTVDARAHGAGERAGGWSLCT
jgi:hypothetical protein